MKKTYLCPMTSVHFVQMEQQLMAGSANGTTVYETEASTEYEILSRRRTSVWGDEEEEDF